MIPATGYQVASPTISGRTVIEGKFRLSRDHVFMECRHKFCHIWTQFWRDFKRKFTSRIIRVAIIARCVIENHWNFPIVWSISPPSSRTIHHQINENEINLTIRPGQNQNFVGEPSHATITIEVSLELCRQFPSAPGCLSFYIHQKIIRGISQELM